MADLLVLADDFTGALDTGVQFARQNIPTLVSTRIAAVDQDREGDVPVIVLDLETRHLSPSQAAARVRRAVKRAHRAGIESFFKKTDSTLRGNIGSELGALLESAGASVLSFIPAYPAAGRTTVGGRQYVDGVPLHLSPYAEDPQDPVLSSYIPEIIADQCSIPTELIAGNGYDRLVPAVRGKRRILVFDARSEGDLRRIADQLERLGALRLTAGCAGFAAQLACLLPLDSRVMDRTACPSQLLVVCGSTNRVSLRQVEKAALDGMPRILLEPAQVLNRIHRSRPGPGVSSPSDGFSERLSGGRDLILQTARGDEDVRRYHRYAGSMGLRPAAVPQAVAAGLAELAGRILRSHGVLTLLVFGGDTALRIAENTGSTELMPVSQISPGVVLSRLGGALLKSGLERVPAAT